MEGCMGGRMMRYFPPPGGLYRAFRCFRIIQTGPNAAGDNVLRSDPKLLAPTKFSFFFKRSTKTHRREYVPR